MNTLIINANIGGLTKKLIDPGTTYFLILLIWFFFLQKLNLGMYLIIHACFQSRYYFKIFIKINK